MKPIFTGLSPNAERDDVLLALRLLVSPWRWKKGSAREMLEKKLSTLLDAPHVYAFESGRTSLMVAVRALNLSAGEEVLLQAYTCVAVPNAVRWAGAIPVYIDCDPHSLTMSVSELEKKITPRSRAIILQHTFGNPGDLSALIALARKRNLVVIEDCAHTIGGAYQGKKLGLFGDIAILSFGRDKAISSVFGGACIVNNEQYAQRIKKMQAEAPLPSADWILQQLLHPLICWLTISTFAWGFGKVILFAAKKLGILSLAVLPCEREGVRPSFTGKQMPHTLAVLALNQLSKLEKYNAHRLAIALQYEKALTSIIPNLKRPFLENNSPWIPLRYTIQVENPDALLRYARTRDIYLGDWYRQSIAPDRVQYDTIGYEGGTCPNAEHAAAASVNLPLDSHIDSNAAERIIACVKEYVAGTNNSTS